MVGRSMPEDIDKEEKEVSDTQLDIDKEEEERLEKEIDEDIKSTADMERESNLWKEVAIRAESERRFVETELQRLQKDMEKIKADMKKMRAPPHIVGTIRDVLTDGRVIVKSSTGPNFVVQVANFINREDLEVSRRISLNRDTLCVIDILPLSTDPLVQSTEVIEKPNISYSDIGGLDDQIREIRETVELPLSNPEIFKRVGIDPPLGVLLVGPPGTGKTMLAQAVAYHTNATFLRLVGSELVQKFIGEGGRLVRELFQMAREKAPSIIFLDELDSIAARRLETGTSADREVQRTLMQLLAEIDGFDPIGDVKILAATNRPDTLDPALTRSGRFDRIIEVPLPTTEARLQIFKIHTKRMNLAPDVDFERLASLTDGLSGAEIKAMCTEAGMFAIREDCVIVNNHYFNLSLDKVQGQDKDGCNQTAAMYA